MNAFAAMHRLGRRVLTPGLAAGTATAILLSSALAQGRPSGPWRMSVEAGAAHQVEADGDDGGSLAVTRTFVEPAIAYGWDARTSVGLSVDLGLSDYDFDGSDGLAGLDPWNRILRYGVSLPIRFGLGPNSSALLVPSVGWQAEAGASLDDAMSAGGVAGFFHRFSDRLSLGPGIVVTSGIEEGTTVLPILLVDWDITDDLSLATGGAPGGGQGPGIDLSWRMSDRLRLGLGASYQTRRFRLDDDGAAPDGVGEDRSASVSASATYSPLPFLQATVLGGVSFAGEIRLEDEDGDEIADDELDPAPFVGFSLRARW